MKRVSLFVALLGCGPGPTTSDPAPVVPTSTSQVTPTKPVRGGPDCNAKAMEKLASTIMDSGMRKDLDASVAEEDVNPSDASGVLRKLEPKLTACNPSEIEGCAFFIASVETDGSVSATETFVSDALPGNVIECLAGVVKDARFATVPKAGKMTVPVTFTRTR